MNYSALSKIRDEFTTEGIQICFNGSFSHSIIEELGKAVRQYLENENANRGATLDVFAVFIEQAQNVQRYTTRTDLPESDTVNPNLAIIVIGKSEEGYWICSGNPVAREHMGDLTVRLDTINGMSKAELKQAYKEQLHRPIAEGQTGAGLGLLDIAKRMSSPFGYSVRDLDDRYVLFILKVTV